MSEHTTTIAIFTFGTQGDIRPCVALGLGLQRMGYLVRIVTSANFAGLVRDHGLEFHPITADFQALLDSNREMADQGLNLWAIAKFFRDTYARWAEHWVEEGLAASKGASLLIGAGSAALLARAIAEACGQAFVGLQLQPLTPSRMLAPMVLAGLRRRLPGPVNMSIYHLLRFLVWRVMAPAVNDIVRPRLGLRGYPWYGPYFNDELLGQTIYGFSRHVVPRPVDWPDQAQVCGYWFLDQPGWQPPESLIEFLEAGPQPVYLGFGSMVGSDAGTLTEKVLEGVRKSGRRIVLATGWGALEGIDGMRSEQVYVLRSAPHDWLFPRMAGAIHHGGAGTTAAAVRAGIPSIVMPFYGGDQPFWAHTLHRLGAAPPPLDRNRIDSDTLAGALVTIGRGPMRRAAHRLGQQVRAEDGVSEALRWLRQWRLLSAGVSVNPLPLAKTQPVSS